MRRRKIGNLALLFSIAAIVSLSGGCATTSGLFVGSVIDDIKSSHDIDRYKINDVEVGKKIKVFLKDSTTVNGRFIGIYEMDDSTYYSNYAQSLAQLPANALPLPGDTITVVSNGRSRQKCFAGFNVSRWNLKQKGTGNKVDPHYHIKDCSEKGPGENDYCMDEITVKDSSGKPMTGCFIARLIDDGRLPLASVARVTTDSGLVDLSYTDIQYFETRRSSAKWIGLGIGASVDLAFLVFAIVAWSGGFGPFITAGY